MVAINKRLRGPTQAKKLAIGCISDDAWNEAIRRDLLHVTGATFRYGDRVNAGTSHRLRDRKWKHSHSSGDEWHRLIGLEWAVEHECPRVLLVLEGAYDALAGYELLRRAKLLEPQTAIVSGLGSGCRLNESEIASLRERKVVLVGDRDAAGLNCVKLASQALCAQDVDHVVLLWPPPAKDLCELVEHHAQRKADVAPLISALEKFFSSPSLPSYRSTSQQLNSSTAQQFNYSTQEDQNRTDELSRSTQDIVEPHVVKIASSGNTYSFKLARALVERYGAALSDEIVRATVHYWFIRSRPLLPVDAEFERTLRKFYGQLSRVRFTSGGLSAARERARSAPLPDIPTLSEPQLRAAALHRELQREAGEASYICPINTIQDFLGQRWPEQARWIQRQLEQAKVILCVKRGIPNAKGFKGTCSFWRYLKEL